MTLATVDRICVFVSSTIDECAAERGVVRDAIRSINHEPILFEDVGARPHPPREVYRSRLEMSHIFVGIYKESYGWVAPDTDISGVEDEFRLAAARGMDQLIYVYRTPTSRDPRLQSLIEHAKGAGITLAQYTDTLQLQRMVRDDLTACVSNRFVDQAVVSHEPATPEEMLQSLIPDPSHRLRRSTVEAELINKLATNRRVAVTGPIGSGKTILTGQVAAQEGWIFVDARQASRLEGMARIANSLRVRRGNHAVMLTSEQKAIDETVLSWESDPDSTVVVDGASDPSFFWNTIPVNRRLVITSRSPIGAPSAMHLQLPRLTNAEILTWVTALQGRQPDPGDVVRLAHASNGSPLYLRFFSLGSSPSEDLTLRQLELRAVQDLPIRAREIVSYLALSPRELAFTDLNVLLDEAPGIVADLVSRARGVLEQRRHKVALVHEHLRRTVRDQLHGDITRHSFFAERIGRFFETSRDYLAAFHVYLESGEHRHADRVVNRAARQAALMGGGALAIPVLRRQIELAAERGAIRLQLPTTLQLAWALRQVGATADALATLDSARHLSDACGDPATALWVKEAEIGLGIDAKLMTERIAELKALRRRCTEKGDYFSSARAGTLLAVEYIAGRDYQRAEVVARDVVRIFRDLGDEYGHRIGRLNLASALSGIEGKQEEAAELAQELQQEIVPDKYPRERAVLCNYLTRFYRNAAEFARAAHFATEAIQIGEQLADAQVIAINRTTLGNVKRDEGKLQDALMEYQAAEKAAVTGARRDLEAAANELIASVHNERRDHSVALHHAQHAAAVARLVGDHLLVARAEEERAIALTGLRKSETAIVAYAEAARAIGLDRPGGPYFVELVTDALHLCDTLRRIDLKAKLLSRTFLEPANADAAVNDPLAVLCQVLPKMAAGFDRPESLLALVALAIGDLLTDRPAVVQRRIVLQSTRAVLAGKEEVAGTGGLAAVAGILMAVPGDVLTLGDVTDLGERVAASAPHLYYKPAADGAANWTLRLRLGGGAVLSIVQLDDEPRTAIVAAMLALLLAVSEGAVRRHLVDVEQLPRDEAVINVVSRKELEAELGGMFPDLGDMPSGYAVSESTDITRGDQPPIVVVRAEEFPAAWHPSREKISNVHIVLGEVLRPLVAHLLARAVEPEVLFPKIGRTVRQLGYSGAGLG